MALMVMRLTKLVAQLGESDREGRRDSAPLFSQDSETALAEELLFQMIAREQAVDLLKKSASCWRTWALSGRYPI